MPGIIRRGSPNPYVAGPATWPCAGWSAMMAAPGKPARASHRKRARWASTLRCRSTVSEAPIPEVRVAARSLRRRHRGCRAGRGAAIPPSRYVCTTPCSNPGALIHLRVGPPGRVQDPELTDTSLSTDLLLLDRCFAELRKVEPRAQHWQAKVVGQVQDSPGARERFDGVHGLPFRLPRRYQRETDFLRYTRGPRAAAAVPSRDGTCAQRAPCRSPHG